MGAITNCCASEKKQRNAKNKIDFDKELTGKVEVDKDDPDEKIRAIK